MGLQALLDRDLDLAKGVVPPLGHWLYFLPQALQSTLDDDGHPRRGGFLPPVPLPRRMWAGGTVRFFAPIRIGSSIERRSTIASVEQKSGQSGNLLFVTVLHEISSAGLCCIEERQNIVYRGAGPADTNQATRGIAKTESRLLVAPRRMVPTPPLLFRYSALTFNAHRIHYDRDYARNVEGYPALVVHAPLTATLLMDYFASQGLGMPASFAFRARKPLLDDAPFDLCLAASEGGYKLWSVAPDGEPAMTARIELA